MICLQIAQFWHNTDMFENCCNRYANSFTNQLTAGGTSILPGSLTAPLDVLVHRLLFVHQQRKTCWRVS